jgi:hypothetical protein
MDGNGFFLFRDGIVLESKSIPCCLGIECHFRLDRAVVRAQAAGLAPTVGVVSKEYDM